MARPRRSKHKISRRFAVDIYGTGGQALERRIHVPPGGFRGRRRRRRSPYALQLEEKQKLKMMYGVSESQLRRYYMQAKTAPGNPGDSLLALLERRLDNVVYRLGFARTRPMARQLVSQGHVRVNERKLNIPSYLVRAGDRITLTEPGRKIPLVVEELEQRRPVPPWLRREDGRGSVTALPSSADANIPVDPRLVVAFYSR